MKKYQKTILLNLFIAIFLILPVFAVKAEINKPYIQVPIPTLNLSASYSCEDGKMCYPWIGEYIIGIYSYAIGIVGILATVILMFGGILWINSRGNQEKVGEAKAWIGAALSGLVLTLASFLILYIINPDLTQPKPIAVQSVKKAPDTSTSKLCADNSPIKSGDTLDYSKITENLKIPEGCKFYDFTLNNQATPEEQKILKAIASQESGCKDTLTSQVGACGLMQLLPSTAGKNCTWLINNPNDSIILALNYIRKNKGEHGYDKAKIFAGYNSGYASINASGKRGGLSPSQDCPGKLAFECCINPGELSETQDYVYKTLQYYNSQ